MATIGTDPEFFVRNSEHQIVPGCTMIGGTKSTPLPLPGLPDGFGVQEDNVMAELTVPPAISGDSFAENIRVGMEKINDLIGANDLTLDTTHCEYVFSHEALDQYAGASVFGCSPDFDAYQHGAQRPTLSHEQVGRVRMCGGHVHIGADCSAPHFVQAMFGDVFLGLWSVGRDPQATRRKWYGQPGTFRPTPYGFEYRTMSNFWTYGEDTRYEVGNYAMNLARFLEQDGKVIREAMLSINWQQVRTLIAENTDDQVAYKLHQTLMQELSI